MTRPGKVLTPALHRELCALHRDAQTAEREHAHISPEAWVRRTQALGERLAELTDWSLDDEGVTP